MSKNKLYNQSYFVKRLLEAGFDVKRLNIHFEGNDLRKWMIFINPRSQEYKPNICVTCFKKPKTSEFSFKFQGQGEKDFTLKTLSMTTVIRILNSVFRKSQEMETSGSTEENDDEDFYYEDEN